jgi:hypothetical protein
VSSVSCLQPLASSRRQLPHLAHFVELFPHFFLFVHHRGVWYANDVSKWSERLCFLNHILGQGCFLPELSTKIHAEVERTMTIVEVASSGNEFYQPSKSDTKTQPPHVLEIVAL